MLKAKAVPLVQSGYRLPSPKDGCGLQHMGLTANQAVQSMGQLVLKVHAGSQQLFGQLPSPPSRPVLLQNTINLLACDWEQVQRAPE